MAQVLKMRFLVRCRTAAEWTAINEILLNSTEGTGARELGIEEDTGKFKLGDGVTAWNDLPYLSAIGGDQFAEASGTNTITATFPTVPILEDGLQFKVRAAAANTSTTPTFNPNGLGALSLTKLGGAALAAGDISGAGHELVIRYRASTTTYELVNPAGVQIPIAGTNIEIDLTNPREPVFSSLMGVVNLKGRKPDYASLPSSGNSSGDAWANDEDTLIYIWDNGWPDEGFGIGTAAYRFKTRFWRVRFTATNGDNYVQFSRLRMMDTPGGPDLCSGGTAFASSTYQSGLGPQYAFLAADAVANQATSSNSWASSPGGIPAFLGYIFPSNLKIRQIKIQAASVVTQTEAPKDFTVQSSKNSTNGIDGTWVDEWVITNQTGWTNAQIRTFNRP